jgi:glycerophosphoryl diester phosphodiesterase
LVAFRRALAVGADGIELDVQLSRDGVPVVMHDDTLERTTDGHGPVSGFSAAALGGLDAGAWFAPVFAGEPVPTLDEVLRSCAGRLRLNLEIKEPLAGKALLEALHAFPKADVVVSSFDLSLLVRLRQAHPGLPLAVLTDGNWHQAVAVAAKIAACALHPHVELVSRPLMAVCRRRQLPVFPWTVDDPSRARSLVRIGVAGIFTNDPLRMRQLFPGDKPELENCRRLR